MLLTDSRKSVKQTKNLSKNVKKKKQAQSKWMFRTSNTLIHKIISTKDKSSDSKVSRSDFCIWSKDVDLRRMQSAEMLSECRTVFFWVSELKKKKQTAPHGGF